MLPVEATPARLGPAARARGAPPSPRRFLVAVFAGLLLFPAVPEVAAPVGIRAQEPASRLALREPRAESLPAGATRRWAVELEGDELALVEVRQRGSDVVVRLLDPGGAETARVDGPTGDWGVERVAWIAGRGGTWTLDLEAEAAGPSGGYEVEWVARRPPTREDRQGVEADRLVDAARERVEAGDYAGADSLFRRALGIREEVFGPDDPEVAAVLDELAEVRYALGEYGEAEELMLRALAIHRRAPEGEGLRLAVTLNNLAAVYGTLGRYEEADSMYRRALAIKEAALGEDHPEVATTVSNLAVLYQSQGRYEEALPLMEKVLEIKERALGPEDPQVADALNNLATLHWTLGRYAEAERGFLRALEIREEGKGPDHPDLVPVLTNLATLYMELGRFTEAEPLFRRSLEIGERALGADHPQVATVLNNLALLYHWQGRYEEAEAFYLRVLAIREQALGPAHPEVATSLNNLASLYADQGRYAEAEPLYERAVAIQEAALGEGHPELANTLTNLANLHGDLAYLEGDAPLHQTAEELYLRALAIREAAFGREHPAVAHTLGNLATTYHSQGRQEEAERALRRALDIQVAALGPDHPAVASRLLDLAAINLAGDGEEEAERLVSRALSIREAALGPDHPDVAVSLLDLAFLRFRAGDAPAALGPAERAARILDATTGGPGQRIDAHALLARIRKRLGEDREALGNLEEALRGVEELRPRLGGGEEARALFFESYGHYFDLMVYWQLEDDRVEEALEWAERGRARVLLDQLAAGKVDLRQGIPADLRGPLEEREDRARARLAEYQQRITRLRGRRDLSDEERLGRIAVLEDSLRLADREYREVYREIKTASPLWRDLITTGGRPAPLTALQRRVVPAGGLLLLYQVGREGSHLFLVPPAGAEAEAHALEVGEAEAAVLGLDPGPLTGGALAGLLESDTTGAGGLLAALGDPGERRGLGVEGGRGTPIPALEALWRVLVPEGVWTRIREAEEVLVVPDAHLHGLPFEALVVSAGPEAGSTRFWLDEGPPIRYAPSATTLYNIDARPRAGLPGRPGALLSVSDPVYDPFEAADRRGEGGPGGASEAIQTTAERTRDSFVRAGGSLTPLPGTALETEAIREAFAPDRALGEVVTLQGVAATEEALRGELAGKRYLHLATHGLVDEARGALFAALALTPPREEGPPADNDGFLQLYEIYDLRLPEVELAVLSACESAVGTRVGGEGVFALSRGFLAAGTRRVVASQWSVNDASTATLMSGFFRSVGEAEKAGRPVDYARALRDAKREVRARPEWADPFHWAPFVLTGTG